MKKIKVIAVVLTVIFVLAVLAACGDKGDVSGDNGSSVGGESGTTAFDLLSKEEIEHIIGYCATFTQKKGTSVWWEYRYFAAYNSTGVDIPDGCVEISVFPEDGTDTLQHDCVDFLYFFKDEESAKKFVELSREVDANDDYSKDREYLIDDTHVYMTSYINDNKTHERIGAVTPEEQKKFYTETVQKATLPSTFSKTRFDFIIESIANKINVSLDFVIFNEYEYDDYRGVHKKETYETYNCGSSIYLGSLEDLVNGNVDRKKAYGCEYMYWSDGSDPVEVGYQGVDKHLDEIMQNGNTEDKYIDTEREKRFSFYKYKYSVQSEEE